MTFLGSKVRDVKQIRLTAIYYKKYYQIGWNMLKFLSRKLTCSCINELLTNQYDIRKSLVPLNLVSQFFVKAQERKSKKAGPKWMKVISCKYFLRCCPRRLSPKKEQKTKTKLWLGHQLFFNIINNVNIINSINNIYAIDKASIVQVQTQKRNKPFFVECTCKLFTVITLNLNVKFRHLKA